MTVRIWFLTLWAMAASVQAQPVDVFAAGSLRDALTQAATLWQQQSGMQARLNFGPSGLLRQRLEQGNADAAAVSVFISADMEHPTKLASAGGWQAPQVLLQNRLCVLAAPSVKPDAEVLPLLLNPATRIGISTPKSDPAGDYAWTMFEKAAALQADATRILQGKALKLTGGPDSPQPPAGRNPYAWVMSQGQVDVFVTYCTNAASARREMPALQVLQVPEALQVSASYGITVRTGAPAVAKQFVQALQQADIQAVFASFGFASPPSAALPSAPAAPLLLKVGGQVRTPLSLTRQDLLALPLKTMEEQRKLSQAGPEVVRHVVYRGVLLRDLLEKAQPTADRRQIRKAVVLLTASDGYQASFSWGELFNSSLGEAVMVILRQDDLDLLATDGLPSLRSLQDTRSGPRHVRWLNQVELLLPGR